MAQRHQSIVQLSDCLSCLIKHIIDHPRTNDSYPITHESNGFGITSTWPRCGLTGLRYRVRVYSPFTALTLLETAFPCRMSQDVALSSAKNSWRENAITARLSYCFRLTFLTEFMNIYESISHLNLEQRCLAGGIFVVSSKCILTCRLMCYPEQRGHNSKKYETSKIWNFSLFGKKNPFKTELGGKVLDEECFLKYSGCRVENFRISTFHERRNRPCILS